jgi:putative transposase
MTIMRTYRTELDPTVAQKKQFRRYAGAARFVYNWAYEEWYKWFKEYKAGIRPEKPNEFRIHKKLTADKKHPQLMWLQDISAFVVRDAVKDLGTAWKNFFERQKKFFRGELKEMPPTPKRRSRKSPTSRGFHMDQPTAVKATTRTVRLATIGEVKLKEHGYIPTEGNWRSVAVHEQAGRWFVAVTVEENAPPVVAPRTERISVEVGVRHVAVTSSGKRFGSVIKLEGLERAIQKRKVWERRLARRFKGPGQKQSKGWRECVLQIQKYHMRAANIRKDFLHQISVRITRQRAFEIVLRNMVVEGMIGRKHQHTEEQKKTRNRLAPLTSQVGLFELRRQIEYKQKWLGRQTIIVANGTPTTRRCSQCAEVREADPGYPDFLCPSCGFKLDREANSAINLLWFAAQMPPAPVKQNSGGTRRRKDLRKKATTASVTVTTAQDRPVDLKATTDGDVTSPLGPGNRAVENIDCEGHPKGSARPDGRYPPHTDLFLHNVEEEKS